MLPGKLYELAIFTNTLINYPDKHFDLGQEIRIGDKFDDLVIRVDGDKYTFVQIKLVDDSEDNVIDVQVLLGEKKISLNKDDFKLQKYFLSNLRIKDQLNSGDTTSTVQKLVIFTNADINDEDVKKEIGTGNIIRDRNDNILNNNENSKSDINININSIFIQKLRSLKCDLLILAEEIAKYVTDSNSNLDPMVLDIECFRYYHTALFDEHVMEAKDIQHGNKIIRLGKFTSDFIYGNGLSSRAHKLRTKLIEIILERQNNIEKLQENMARAEWKLSDDFGLTESKDVIFLPNYEISEKDVVDFFSILELRVNQPGVKDLLKMNKNEEIKNKFLEYFDTDPNLVEFLINDFIQGWRSQKTAQERWLLNSKRSEFIKELQIKIAKPQAIHTTQQYVRYIESLIKKYNLRFHDTCLFNKNYFLGKQKEKYFLISTASNILSSIKMLQYLNETKHQNYIFIDLDSLSVKREIIKLVDAFNDTKYNLFILSYKSLGEEDIINEIFNKLSSITNEHTNKQVIFITVAVDSLVKRFNSCKEYKDRTVAIEHFVDDSKINILQQEVTIQNQAIPIGNLCDMIGPEVIDKLITSKIDIGSATSEMNYLEGAYTEVFEEVNMESLIYELTRQSSDIYVISDISGSWKRCIDKLRSEIGMSENDKLNIITSQTEVLKWGSPTLYLKSKIYVSGEEFKNNDFRDLCKKNPDTKIYWINIKNDGTKCKFLLSHIYNPKFYINGQRFSKEVIIKRNIKEQLSSSKLQERYCIFGINKKQMIGWLRLNRNKKINFNNNYQNKQIQFFSSHDNLNGVSQQLEQQNVDETVHLLKFEQGHLKWCKTYGSIEILCKYRGKSYKNIEPLLDENDVIKEIKDKKLVIIAGEPGIGKSTALSKLCSTKFKLKSNLEDSMMISHWIIKVNLRDHVQLIRNIVTTVNDQISRMIIVKFLLQVDKSLNDDIAKSFLEVALTKSDFGKPLIIAFDGFDEILDKEDRDRVIVLLQQIRYKTTAKVWVTTRLHYEKTLERNLSTFSIRLEAMDTGKVRKYIKTYFRDNLNLILSRNEFITLFNDSGESENTVVLHVYTEAFLNKIYELFKSQASWFIGTPLQLYLMLEGSLGYFMEWISNYNTQNPDFSYLGNDIWEVYEKFVERKYDTYLKKRNIKESVKQKLEKSVFDEFHRDLAKSSILESNVKKSFLGLKDVFLSAGIVKSDGQNIEFIHPTFQEYFAAKLIIHWIRKWSREGQHKLTNLLKKAYLVEDILTKSYYQVIRAFLNVKLSNEKLKTVYLDKKYYNEQIMLLAIKENYLGIANFLLHNFQNIDVDNSVRKGPLDSPLKTAAMSGNLKMLKLLVKYSSHIDNFNNLCSSLLHDAGESGNIEMVKYLIENGADIDAKDIFDETILHKVVSRSDNFEIVKLFVQKHGDVNAINSFGNVALHRAVTKSANLEMVKYLVQNGADINAEGDSGEQIFYKAAQSGNPDLVKFLLNNGIEIHARSKIISNALDIAIKNGVLELVKLFVHNGADVNSKRRMLNAVDDPNKLEIVKFLVTKGANVDETDIYGETVLFKAVAQPGNFEMVKYLISKGADVHIRDNRDMTVIHKAVAQPCNTETVKILIESGVNINSKNNSGEVPLSIAVQYSDLDMVIFLVKCGADVNVRDNSGKTIICSAVNRPDNIQMIEYLVENCRPLNIADKLEEILSNAVSIPSNLNIVKFLYKQGVNINCRNRNGETVLITAVNCDSYEIAKFLVQKGADVSATDKCGRTVLHASVSRGNLDMMNILIEYGANVHSRNKDGTTALHIASQLDNTEAVKILVQNGLTIDARSKDDLLVLRNAAEANNKDMFKYLIQHCSNIECSDEIYTTLLHDAAENGNIQMIECLIDNGANVNAEDERGQSILYKAVGFSDICGVIQYHERERVKGKGIFEYDFTDLKDDLFNNQTEIVNFLLKSGAIIDVTDKKGVLILKRAAEFGRLGILKLLVGHVASIGQLDNTCASILIDAVESGNKEMVKFLIETLLTS